MPEILQYTFMQKALSVGLLIGILCPTIGMFLVLRRFAMIGDTLAHISLAGVLLGVIWGISPLPLALFLSALVAFLLEKTRNIFKDYAELSLAIIMSVGLGLSAILMGSMKTSDTSISSLLFGSIITINNQDLLVIGFLSVFSLGLLFFFYRQLFFLTFDEEGAHLAGIQTKLYNYLLLFLTAMVITIGLKIVGALLISSLMVVPVATSLLLSQGFKKTLFGAIIFGILSILIGLTTSFYLDLAPGGTIILSSTSIFLIVLLGKKIQQA